MPTRADIAETMREIITTSWPSRFNREQLRDGAPLGEDGLGLDSVEVVEVLFACADRCEQQLTDDLFETAQLTIEGVAEYFATA